MKTNKRPIVNFEGVNWEIISVQGDNWNSFETVFIDEEGKIRYNHDNLIFPMFEYKITSRKINPMRTNVYYYNNKNEQITAVRGKIFVYDENGYIDINGFGCTFYLQRNY